MMPLDMLHDTAQGTTLEWVLLAALLPLVGHAVVRSWGPAGVLAAQRALLLVLVDLAYSLLLALPLHAGPLLLATLPLLGAAASRTRGTLRGAPWAWVGAALLALPVLALAHLGPAAWAPWWFLVLFGAALLRGLVEPVVARVREAAPAAREWWAERTRGGAPETTVK